MNRSSRELAALGLFLLSPGLAAQDAPVFGAAALERTLALEGPDRHVSACSFLGDDLLSQVSGVAPGDIEDRPMTLDVIPHAVCTRSWAKPDAEALETACQERMLEYGMARARAMGRQETFDEPIPVCPSPTESVSLTVIRPLFDSAEEAVGNLEEVVRTLEEGVDYEALGQERTVRISYDRWVDGVGDRAAWAPEQRELQVAWDGIRFAVTISGLDDEEASLARAIEVAKGLIGG